MENTYWDRTDSLAKKLELAQQAFAAKNHRLARALLASARSTVQQAQHEEDSLGTPFPGPARDGSHRPAPWQQWAKGWSKYVVVHLDETAGVGRPPEPVELIIRAETTSLARELRVAQIDGPNLREVPSQVFSEIQRGPARLCKLLFFASGGPHQRQTFLLFYGNPDAELPDYPSDLKTTGEGFALDIENDFFKASLSRQMGQLERLTFKR